MVFTQKSFPPGERTLSIEILCIITVIIIWGVFAPTVMYYGYKFFRYRETQALKKRFSSIVCIEIILVLLSFLFNGCVILADYWENVILRNIGFYTAIIIQYNILYCWLLRFWLLFYYINWLNQSLNIEWKRLLNPKLGRKNFYIDNKNKYGNKLFCWKVIAILIIFASIITVPTRIIYDATDNEYPGEIPYIFFILLPFVLLLIILIKLPKFDDNIYIAIEMKYVISVLFLILIAFIAQEIPEHYLDTNVDISLNIVYYFLIEFSNFCAILIATKYVMNKLESLLIQQKSYKKNSIYLSKSVNSNPQQPISKEMADYIQLNDDLLELGSNSRNSLNVVDNNNDDDDDNTISLNSILEHPKAFDLFMNHVAKEFSIECLLSYVEFIQFNKYMFRHLSVSKSADIIRQKSVELHHSIKNHKGSLGKSEIDVELNDNIIDIKFPSNVPKSEIVYQDDPNFSYITFEERAKHKIYKLYEKYVKVGSDLEINISHRSREALCQMIDKYDNWMNNNKYKNFDSVFLMHIFDKCIGQMRNLLISSYCRFRNSNQYGKLQQFMFVD